MRFTAGFGETNLNDVGKTPDEYLDMLAKTPLRYQPGTRWVYGGHEMKVLSILIEKITNLNLHDYLTKVLFKPLKMASTGFYVEPKNMARFSSYYLYENGKQTLMDNAPTSRQYFQLPAICNGSGGIVSSAQDLANFYGMILNYGTFKGKQILRPQTVELLISNQIAGINDRGWAVAGFGLGVGVNQGRLPLTLVTTLVTGPDTEFTAGKTKSIFWQGSPYNTRFLIDFDKQLISIFLTQNAPFTYLDLMRKFEKIVNKNVN